MLGVFGSEDFDEGFKDGDVGWVGSGLRTVLFLECGHEIREYGIVVFGSDIREAGIWFTQVGDPLSDGSEDLRYGANADIVLTAAWSLAVAVGVDDDVVESVLDIRDVDKSRVNGEGVAEFGPTLEVLAGGSPGSRDIGRRGGLERRAEVSREASSGGRVRSRQGLSCGYCWSKWERKSVSERWKRRDASSAITLARPGMKKPREQYRWRRW